MNDSSLTISKNSVPERTSGRVENLSGSTMYRNRATITGNTYQQYSPGGMLKIHSSLIILINCFVFWLQYESGSNHSCHLKKKRKKTWPVYYTDGLEWSSALLRCILNITKLFVVKFVDVWCLLFSDLQWFVWAWIRKLKVCGSFLETE